MPYAALEGPLFHGGARIGGIAATSESRALPKRIYETSSGVDDVRGRHACAAKLLGKAIKMVDNRDRGGEGRLI